MKNSRLKTREIALYGLFIALVYVATRFINIPGPTPGGLFHLGNVMFFSIAMVFGKKAGAVSGAFGMALFDLTSPFAIWAPFTFVVRWGMGYAIGEFAFKEEEKNHKRLLNLGFGVFLAFVIMIVGYYIAEVILYGNLLSPLQSVWGNFMQCVVGTVIGVPVSEGLRAGFKARRINTEV